MGILLRRMRCVERMPSFKSVAIAPGVRKNDQPMQRKWRLSAEPASLALLIILNWSTATHAHDIYTGLTSVEGKPCCDISDCRPAQFRITAANVQMSVDQIWVAIPAQRIQYLAIAGDNGETGGGHWCGWVDPTEGLYTHCAILPPLSAANTRFAQFRN